MWDVVVVGFGAAGACAAIEAAEAGARVLVIDRFGGGGATAISGGVIYAGGGTRFQHQAKIKDNPRLMYEYLRTETRDAVSPVTLRRFCEQSAEMLDWLTRHGVPFGSSVCPVKTSYPTNRHYLYVSGSEDPPVPRGHRTRARGTSGHALHRALAEAVRAAGAEVHTQTRAIRLTGGGVECRTLTGWPRLAHRVLHRLSVKPGLYLPGLGRVLHRQVIRIEDRHSASRTIPARAVVLAAGGFVFNREMMREHAPAYRRGLRLGTPGDDGSGIRLGVQAGGVTAHLDRVTLWRFLTPPSALAGGLLVDRDGRRICAEWRYGAAIGDAVLRRPGGRAWLLVDAQLLAAARRQVWRETLWFQRWQAWWMLGPAGPRMGRVSASDVEGVARRAGVDPAGLAATVRDAGRGGRGPWSLIDVSIGARGLPAPMLTLGGLAVNEETGELAVSESAGEPAIGAAANAGNERKVAVYAAGRNAAGICSGAYVSGLSLADCVFSGRRAGRHSAAFALGGADAQRR
ncbi:putative FAD-dependent oxidoreductase [Actinoplanes missouriensis 431]|uniref:Putative FAD-dependent oxidoreductase n=1 Tax=Actinoplanes missouriensis (strain ATCC 14538 / DSM 43046 / CBS 188.64 / JCM 3121 / NBRC 102363 / NCIMB 12654 / NRRL B-3342 / UNCC 431) TaxID=512565 RepID=I0H296_ACTM4|nr:putative FAD-dependent oxidoreductase [Actinoplanes missouriensis 431]